MFIPTDQTVPLLKEKVGAVIRDSIVQGALKPGEQLVEASVAKALNVSRAVLREALWVLEKQGWVRNVPRKGAFVGDLSIEAMEEIYELRLALEPVAAARARENLQPPDKVELGQIFSAMKNSASQYDRMTYYEKQLRFHQKIWSLGGNRKLEEILNTICPLFFTFLRINRHVSRDSLLKDLRIHNEIFDALEGSNVAQIEASVRASIQRLTELGLEQSSNER